MLGRGKVPASARPTALGSLQQAATYGMAIPTIYGTTQSALLAIWAANLREGQCRGKKAKSKLKKGPPNYIENIDFLIGSNPIDGVLQVWNNTTKYPLNFLKVSGSPSTGFGHPSTYTISDANFYWLLAVTAELTNSGVFSDYGADYITQGLLATAAFGSSRGSGYAPGDTFNVIGTSGGTGAVGLILAVGGGVILGFEIISGGTGYVAGDTATTSAITGSGSGLTLSGLTLGAPYNDTSEFPLWNTASHGPDLIDAGYHKYWPYVYKWVPTDGATIYFPQAGYDDQIAQNIPNFSGTMNFYYAQLSSVISREPPLAYSCLEFESELGNNSSVYAPEPTQQITYPEYAGCGSPNIDLGASGAIPQLRPEVMGSFKKWPPRGDADFADMIEDTIKSGILQVGAQLGLIQRGVNLNDLPGATDKLVFWAGEPTANSSYYQFQQPIQQGQIICAFSRWRWGAGTGTPSISDTYANTWIPVMVVGDDTAGCGFWYAIANGNYPAGTEQITTAWNGSGGFPYEQNSYAWVMDPSTVAEVATATNGGGPPGGSGPFLATCSITVPGPCWIAVAHTQSAGTGIPPPFPVGPLWQNLFPNVISSPAASNQRSSLVLYRYVAAAGTYTVQIVMNINASWQIGMVALSQAQPASSFPKALGNVIDLPSLDVVRKQCQAAGLMGSVSVNSQQDASQWLKQFYQCADAAPVWSGFTLKSIARSEVSAVGNGVVFISPTASGPVATLTEANLVGDKSKPLVTITRKAQVDSYNIIQAQFFDRTSDYNPSTASEPLSGAIALFGPRKQAPTDLPMIQDPAVARMVLAIEARRYNLLRNLYSFTAKANFAHLEAMDLILINESKLGISNLPVRITKIVEDDKYQLQIEAEPFVYGCHAPQQLPATVSSGNPGVDTLGTVSDVNTPIIFEPVTGLTNSTVPQVWIVVSSSAANYGGCAVLVSQDGGASYVQLDVISGNAITGITVGDWPAANDPDTSNDLAVDLTESLGELEPLGPQQRDSFAYPCYVAGGIPGNTISATSYAVTSADSGKVLLFTGATCAVTMPSASSVGAGFSVTLVAGVNGSAATQVTISGGIIGTVTVPSYDGPSLILGVTIGSTGTSYRIQPLGSTQISQLPGLGSGVGYELMCFDIATLTASYKYTLPATAGGTNELRRGVFGAPGPTVGIGCDHPGGSRFAFLGTAARAPSPKINAVSGGPGILKVPYSSQDVGKTLFFKFLAYNTFGNQLQDQASAAPYSYVIGGSVGAPATPNSSTYQVIGGALSQPTATTIDMAQATVQFPSNAANYNARTFTIPAPSSPTTYYVTIQDPNQLGDTGSTPNLNAQCLSAPTYVGMPGWIFIGSIVAEAGGGGTVTVNGGSSPGAGSGGTVLINGA